MQAEQVATQLVEQSRVGRLLQRIHTTASILIERRWSEVLDDPEERQDLTEIVTELSLEGPALDPDYREQIQRIAKATIRLIHYEKVAEAVQTAAEEHRLAEEKAAAAEKALQQGAEGAEAEGNGEERIDKSAGKPFIPAEERTE